MTSEYGRWLVPAIAVHGEKRVAEAALAVLGYPGALITTQTESQRVLDALRSAEAK